MFLGRLIRLSLFCIFILTPMFTSFHGVNANEDPQIVPEVIDVYPFPGTEMSGQEPLTISFNTSMDKASVQAAFSLEPELDGLFVWIDSRTVSFEPMENWGTNTTLTMTLGNNAKSTAGVSLAEPYIAEIRGISALRVTSITPTDSAEDVPRDAQILVSFNRPVVPLTSLTMANELPEPLTISPEIAGSGEWLNTSLYVFTPDDLLWSATTYEVSVDDTLVSVDGARFEQSLTSSFTTTPPRLISINTEGATSSNGQHDYDVPLDTNITVRFSEAMDRLSTQSAFKLQYIQREVNPAQPDQFVETLIDVDGIFEWTEDSTTLYFTPDELLKRSLSNQRSQYGSFLLNYVVTIENSARTLQSYKPLKTTYSGDNPPVDKLYFSTIGFPGVRKVVNRSQMAGNDSEWRPGDYPIIDFDTPMDTDSLKEHLIIDPEPDNWEILKRGFVYIVYYSQAETTYTITIKAGATDVFGEKLKEDFVFSYTTGKIGDQIRLGMQYNYFRPIVLTNAYRDDTVVPFVYSGTPFLTFDLHTFSPAQLEFERYQFKLRNIEDSPLYRQWTSFVGDRTAHEKAINIPLASANGGQLPLGLYLLRIRGFSRFQAYGNNSGRIQSDYADIPIAVASANVTVKRTPSQVWALVTDMQTAAPLSNVPVTVYNGGEVITVGHTDHNGTFHADVDLYNDITPYPPGNTELVVVAQDENTFGIWYSWQETTGPTQAFYMYTDRPIYRPGETIYFKGFLLDRWDMDFSTPSEDQTAHVYVSNLDQYGVSQEAFYDEEIPLTEFGSFSGAIDIPEDIPLGGLRITYDVRRTLDEFSRNYGVNGSITVEIADFRVNNHEVNVSVNKDEIIQGDSIDINVDAHFYSGEGVSNAPVNMYLSGCLKLFEYDGDGQYLFYDENWQISGQYWYRGESYDRYGNCQEYFDGARPSPGEEYLYNNEWATDDTGNFLLETSQTNFYNRRPSEMLVEATVNSGGQYVSAQDFVMAHPADVYIGIRANPRRTASTEDQINYNIITVNLDSSPAPNSPVQLILEEIAWEQYKAYDAYGWYYRWRETSTFIDEAFSTSDENGLVHFSYIPDRPGTYRLRAITLDDKGRQNSASYRIYVTGSDFRGWYPSENHQLEIVTGTEDFRIGDQLEIFTALPEEAKWTIWLSIERTEVIYQDVFYVDGSSFEYQLEVLKEFASHADISIVAVRGPTADDPYPEYYLASKPITVATDFRQLDIAIVPSTDKAQPGDDVSFDITVTDSDGNPVNAELSVKLTDAAILALLPPNSNTLDSAFYGRYWHSIDTGISLRELLDRYIVALPNPFSGGYGGGGCCPGPKVPRVKFEQTPLWEPHVVTDENGKAVVSVQLPDNLTRWELEVKAFTTDGFIGEATTDVTTNLPLTVRPITPRFFVVGDHLQIGAIVSNNSDIDQQVTSSVHADGVAVEEPASQTREIEAHTQKEVYWWVTVEDTDLADLTFAVEDEQGNQDAAKPMLATGDNNTIPVYRYVAPDIVATVGVLPDAGRRIEGIAVPHRLLDADGGELVLNIDSSLADTTLAGLDYLRQYPYQCVEQTVSRFLPNVATYQALKTFNLANWSLRFHLLVAYQQAHDRLLQGQHPRGGWAWFPNMNEADVQVTAYAVFGLLEAQKAGLTVDQNMLDRALSFLDFAAKSPEDLRLLESSWELDRQAFVFFVIAHNRTDLLPQLDALYDQREKLSLQSRSFLLISYDKVRPDSIAVPVLVDELRNAAIYTSTGVHWSDNASGYNWTTSTRTTALVLKALLLHDPESDLLPQVVRWLITQREHKHWSSTQETTWAILALTDWMVYTKELRSDYSYDVRLNDDNVDTGEVSPETPLDDRALVITVEEYLTDETNYLSVSRSDGDGSLYYSAYLHLNFKASDVEAVGRGITIDRQYILDEDERSSITEAQQGDLITVRLSFTLTEDVHYFVLEDPIPAGVEMVDTQLLTTTRQADGEQFQRGNYWGWGWWWIDRTELQDHQARLYADFLPAGSYVYSYQVRATHQGEFQVIPTQAMAFYTPEIFARSNGMELTITD